MSFNCGAWNAPPEVDAVPPAGPLDVLQWIDAWFQASEDLADLFPGGIHFARSEPYPERPFLLVDVLSEVPQFSTEDLHLEATRIQFAIVADSLPAARELRRVLMRHETDGLDRVTQSPLGGPDLDAVVTTIRVGGASVLDPSPNPEAGEAVLTTVDYLFLLSRN